MKVCPNCKLWDTAAGDIFCSWCGYRLVGIQAELARNRFSLEDLPPPVDLVLSNRSDSAPITVSSLVPSEAWIHIDLGDKKLPLVINPQATEILSVSVDTTVLEDGYHPGSILVSTSVGDENLRLEVAPPPEISVSAYSGGKHRDACRFDVLLDGRDLERNLVRIEAKRGVIPIASISTDQPEWLTVRLPNDCHLPLVLDARKVAYIDLSLEVNEPELYKKSTKMPAQHVATLRISGDDDFTREEQLFFECWMPPALWIWDQAAVDAWPGEHRDLRVTVQNSDAGNPQSGTGNASLVISKVEILKPTGEDCDWLKPSFNLTDRIEVAGGSEKEIVFSFETDPAGKGDGTKLGIGRHSVMLVLTTNLAKVTERVRLEVSVRRVRRFRGVLAIDFGTSNTCCAVADSDEQYVLAPIDSPGNSSRTTAPTVIQYLDLEPRGEIKTRIGTEVELLIQDEQVIRSTARSLKRRLGTPTPFDIYPYNSPEIMVPYLARKVTADYLRQVRNAIERWRPGSQFHNIVITHPSRFRLRQIMELKEAVNEAFGKECEIDLLPEPVAAALSFIMDTEALQKDRYTIGVLDFGGGTTDLSLLGVVNERNNGFVEVKPRQLKCAGRWFGGEDLTQFVYRQGLIGCQRVAAVDYQGLMLDFDSKGITNGNQRRAATENHGRLMQWAERSKLLLFSYGDDHVARLPKSEMSLSLTMWNGVGREEKEFRHDQIVPKRAELDDFLRSRVEELAADLAQLVALSGATMDYIRLSGKSSSIPVVREVLAERFPEAQLRPAAEPKECVVEGACIKYHTAFALSAFPTFENSDFVQTTSRIGIADGKKFKEIIGLGTPVSEAGIQGQVSIPLHSGMRIRLLENSSLSPSLPGNKDITLIGEFKPDLAYTGTKTVSAVLELHLSRDFTPTLVARIPNQSEPVNFVPVRDPAEEGGR
jgi:hypothetical protein